MRSLFAAAALAAFALPGAAVAGGPVSLPQLAPGEVLLEVDGLAIVRTRATSATITATLYGRGASEAEAQRALDAEVASFTAAARASGAGASDVTIELGGSSSADLRDFDVMEESGGQPNSVVQATVTARIRDVARAREIGNRFGEGDSLLLGFGGPTYALDDDSAPRREARAQAIAAARADAESFAAAAGMRIVRMVRITDREGLDFSALLLTERDAAARIGPYSRRARDSMVETMAVVGVDYVLAPR